MQNKNLFISLEDLENDISINETHSDLDKHMENITNVSNLLIDVIKDQSVLNELTSSLNDSNNEPLDIEELTPVIIATESLLKNIDSNEFSNFSLETIHSYNDYKVALEDAIGRINAAGGRLLGHLENLLYTGFSKVGKAVGSLYLPTAKSLLKEVEKFKSDVPSNTELDFTKKEKVRIANLTNTQEIYGRDIEDLCEDILKFLNSIESHSFNYKKGYIPVKDKDFVANAKSITVYCGRKSELREILSHYEKVDNGILELQKKYNIKANEEVSKAMQHVTTGVAVGAMAAGIASPLILLAPVALFILRPNEREEAINTVTKLSKQMNALKDSVKLIFEYVNRSVNELKSLNSE